MNKKRCKKGAVPRSGQRGDPLELVDLSFAKREKFVLIEDKIWSEVIHCLRAVGAPRSAPGKKRKRSHRFLSFEPEV